MSQRARLVTLLVVCMAAVVIAGVVLVLQFGWAVALVAAPIIAVLLFVVLQTAGILSREGP